MRRRFRICSNSLAVPKALSVLGRRQNCYGSASKNYWNWQTKMTQYWCQHIKRQRVMKNLMKSLGQRSKCNLSSLGITKHSTRSHIYGKEYIGTVCQKRTEELLSLRSYQLGIKVGFMTRRVKVKEHLHEFELYEGDLNCRLCNNESERAKHIMCGCETLDHRRYLLFWEQKVEQKPVRC